MQGGVRIGQRRSVDQDVKADRDHAGLVQPLDQSRKESPVDRRAAGQVIERRLVQGDDGDVAPLGWRRRMTGDAPVVEQRLRRMQRRHHAHRRKGEGGRRQRQQDETQCLPRRQTVTVHPHAVPSPGARCRSAPPPATFVNPATAGTPVPCHPTRRA